jgi:predicted alpha/beta hydrolase family esterase
MAHVTFIHGIGNKPAPDILLDSWERSLADDGGVDLASLGITSSMVYWADVLYDETAGGTYESAGPDGLGQPPDEAWRNEVDVPQRAWLDSLESRLEQDPVPEVAVRDDGDGLERMRFPVGATRVVTKLLLRDVHHYLFNATCEPRPGDRYRVQDEVRARMLEKLRTGTERPGPHVVVSHSMGTVIAYDCLARIPECPRVDGLITIGSPLGIEEIPERFRPEWSPNDGFPAATLAGDWVNVFDRLDPVAATAPHLARRYLLRGTAAVVDVEEPNWGTWRHDIDKYLRGAALRAELARMLGVA